MVQLASYRMYLTVLVMLRALSFRLAVLLWISAPVLRLPVERGEGECIISLEG